METIKLTISDETLRDGEQQVGLFFEDETKRTLAHLIAQTGVEQIALMPAIHQTEEQLVKRLICEGLGSQLAASTMLEPSFIEQSKACGVEQIILFQAVSDRLLFFRDSVIRRQYDRKAVDEIPSAAIARVRQNMIVKVLQNLRYAAEAGLKISFAAEDASRANFDFLSECICTFAPYLEQFILCDTVGVLTPEKTYIWLHDLLEYNRASLTVHFHNDRGLALENTIQAVLAGATGVSGTFGGIGERAGNAAIEQVLTGLKMRFGWQVAGIDYDAVTKVTKYLEQLGIRANPPYSRQAQQYETGIHVNSIVRDRASYCLFPYSEPEIWFGKYSGASNFQYLFESLQKPLTKAQYEWLRSQIKTLSIQAKRSFSTEEVLLMLEQGVLIV